MRNGERRPTKMAAWASESTRDVGGQSLSKLEQFWLTHTNSLPDATVYSFTIVVLFAAIHAIGLPAFLLPRLLPPFLVPTKLQPHARNPPASIIRACIANLLVYGLFISPLVIFSYPIMKFLGIRMDLPLPSVGEIIAQNLAYFLIEDYITYWLHRWYHTDWAYKTFHRTHHEYSTPDSFTSIYAHPAEAFFGFLPFFVGILIIPPHIITFWVYVAFIYLHAFEIHCGYDLYWSPTKLIPFYGGSKYHDYHHRFGTKCASNFAHVLTVVDSIHGTNKGYFYRKSLEREKEMEKKMNSLVKKQLD